MEKIRTEAELLQSHLLDIVARRRLSGENVYSLIRRDYRSFVKFRTGASKGVFVLDNCVIKFDLYDDEMSPNEVEYENYRAAKEEGLEDFFAPVELYYTAYGMRFYKQELCVVDEEYNTNEFVEYLIDNEVIDSSDDDWENTVEDDERVYCFLGYTGATRRLVRFLNQKMINDCHCGNWGIRQGRYKLIDYCGY